MMLQRIPATLDADAVRRQLDELGYRARYDAVHVPMNRGSTLSMRYAFVNFVCPEDAARCIRECAGKPFGSSADVAPICNAEYARGQGAAYVLAQATKAKPKAGGVEGPRAGLRPNRCGPAECLRGDESGAGLNWHSCFQRPTDRPTSIDLKSTPERLHIDPRSTSKRPDAIPKRPRINPKDPNACPKRPRKGPNSTPHRPRSDSNSSPNRPRNDPRSTPMSYFYRTGGR